jgi:hypothetical protein
MNFSLQVRVGSKLLSFLSWTKMEISKLTFLHFVYIMATGMILLARISYAMILHNKIPLCADSVPEHNFDPSAFSILTIQENCVH